MTKKSYKKSGRKLSKSPSNSPLMRSVRRRYGTATAGHSKISKKQLTRKQRLTLSDKKSVVVKIRGVGKRRITPGNVFSDGHIEYYKRSDTKKIAIRRPGSDKKRTARRKGTTKKPMLGD